MSSLIAVIRVISRIDACEECRKAIQQRNSSSVSKLVDEKSQGRLIHANTHVEETHSKHIRNYKPIQRRIQSIANLNISAPAGECASRTARTDHLPPRRLRRSANREERGLLETKQTTNISSNKLISFVEFCFAKHANEKHVFDLTMDEVLSNYNFTFPCLKHASKILSYAIYYYIRLRMRQFTYQENQKKQKQFFVKNKLAKLTKQ